MTSIFQHKDIKLHYRCIGSGKTPILAFHGFTRTSIDYELFEPFLKDDYTIYAVDLFYHGKTSFKSKNWKSFSKTELKEIFAGFLVHINVKRFEVMGYSMGGRVALFLIEQFATRIDHLYLLAPDGLKTNFRHIKFSQAKLAKLINKNKIKTDIVVGHKDPVVKIEVCEKFYNRIKKNATLHKIKSGHDLFRPFVIEFFKKTLFK